MGLIRNRTIGLDTPMTLRELLRYLRLDRTYDTVYRWAKRGIQQNGNGSECIKLETIKIGAVAYTTLEKYYRFLVRQNPGTIFEVLQEPEDSVTHYMVRCLRCDMVERFWLPGPSRNRAGSQLQQAGWTTNCANYLCPTCGGCDND